MRCLLSSSARTDVYTLSLHDALPIYALDLARALADLHQLGVAVEALDVHLAHVAHPAVDLDGAVGAPRGGLGGEQLRHRRSEEHTSELQSQSNLVCPPLLEKTHAR